MSQKYETGAISRRVARTREAWSCPTGKNFGQFALFMGKGCRSAWWSAGQGKQKLAEGCADTRVAPRLQEVEQNRFSQTTRSWLRVLASVASRFVFSCAS